MASGLGDHTESDRDEHLPQISLYMGTSRKRMRGKEKSSKPPRALKKKEHKPEEVPQGSQAVVAQPEEGATNTEEQGLLSDGKPRTGDHGHEPDTTAEMSDPDQYRTRPHGKTILERNSRLQGSKGIGQENCFIMKIFKRSKPFCLYQSDMERFDC